MINSAVLENYAPLIVPLTFIYGLKSVIQSMPLGQIELIGNIFIIISLLIYYDRVASDNKEIFIMGLVLFFISYAMIRVLSIVWLMCLIIASLILIGKGALETIDFSADAQYVYVSLIVLFVGFIFTIIENNNLPPQPIALVINAIGISILTLSTMKLSKA